MKTIIAEKLIEIFLRKLEDYADDAFSKESAVEALRDSICEIETLRWIPVEELLPKRERKEYWVCTDTGYQCECRWTNDIYGFGESDRWGWKLIDIPQYQKVTAWRALPKPYDAKINYDIEAIE